MSGGLAGRNAGDHDYALAFPPEENNARIPYIVKLIYFLPNIYVIIRRELFFHGESLYVLVG